MEKDKSFQIFSKFDFFTSLYSAACYRRFVSFYGQRNTIARHLFTWLRIVSLQIGVDINW